MLDHVDLKDIQGEIIKLQENYRIPIMLAPGFYTHNLFACSPLQQKEFNIDWRGNITLCCHLSGCGNGLSTFDIIGNLNELSFKEANYRLTNLIDQLSKHKIESHDGPHFNDMDYFSCLYCLNYFEKITELKLF
jgi:hypothetical protein